jgi:hypothetical protein
MQQLNLFEPPPVVKPNKQRQRCKNCTHCYRHQYNNSFYCKAKKQKGTAYGHQKIKANDFACIAFLNIDNLTP